MQLSRRRFAALSTAWLAGSASRLLGIPPRPKLFVLIVAEQFRSDYLSRFTNQFTAGGFRRLMDDGAFFPDCRLASSSFSSTGIATIATGAYPEAHGIIAESWYDPDSKKIVSAHSSLTQSSTLADQIAAADTRNRVLATGMNRARAELLVGRHSVLSVEPGPEEPAWMAAFRQYH